MKLARLSNSKYPSFPSLFDRFLEGDWMDWSSSNFASNNSTLPAINIKDEKDNYKIEVAAPGMKKKDFKVNYNNGQLTISSEHKEEKKDKGDNYSRREFNYQSFKRTFTISETDVNSDKIAAKYSDGILLITIPKREEAKVKPANEIKIV